jgi:hypothetical protein
VQGTRHRGPLAARFASFEQRVAEIRLGVHQGAIVVRIAPDHHGVEGRDHERDRRFRPAYRQIRGDGAKAGSYVCLSVGHLRLPPR